jgi:hypothetical protein
VFSVPLGFQRNWTGLTNGLVVLGGLIGVQDAGGLNFLNCAITFDFIGDNHLTPPALLPSLLRNLKRATTRTPAGDFVSRPEV